MLKLPDFPALLADVNVEAVAAESGLSTKTIYRLRKGSKHTPTIKTAQALMTAIKRVKKQRRA